MSLNFDRYLVWNHYNRQELSRGYPGASLDKITLVGPVQFDFYWDESCFWTEAEWRCQLGIPEEKTVLLYAGNIAAHVPHEPVLVQQIDEAIRCGDLPDSLLILLRLHPMDSHQRWSSLLANSQNIILDGAFKSDTLHANSTNFRQNKQGFVGDDDVKKHASTLRYSQVHVNVCSTMTLDGAVFDHPQINPAYDDTPGRKYDRMMREHYQREHYLPIVQSGGVDVVYHRDELIRAIRRGIVEPMARSAQRKKMLEDVCGFLDGRCTQRVSDALQRFLTERNMDKNSS